MNKVQTKPVEMNNTAYSIYRDPVTSQWVLGEIKFDPVSGTSNAPKIIEADLNKGLIQERFKIAVARTFFGMGS
jgi:hypothetical protein